MFDPDTLVITYDPERGEPRSLRKKGVDARTTGLGDCIDCGICVQVCPTGIDIRNGLQYECIGCAACIDACDQVMDKMKYPRGLIRYTTENALEKRWGRNEIGRPCRATSHHCLHDYPGRHHIGADLGTGAQGRPAR